MPRITATLYKLREGDPIDNQLIMPVAAYAASNGIEQPNILFIESVHGTVDEKMDIITKAIQSVADEDNLFIIALAAISMLEFPQDKYTLEKTDENDEREVIPVEKTMIRELNMFNDLGFEAYPGDTKALGNMCVYTVTDNGRKLLDFVLEEAEKEANQEPTHMRVTQEELANMMGGANNEEATGDEENDNETVEAEEPAGV